jgi:RHS repeat-associated protein
MKAAESFNVAVSGKDVAATCTTYDATGKPKQVSNPFFLAGTAGADPSGLTSVCSTGRSWTTTTYDVLGRPTSVVAPDSSTVTNSYVGLTTTATDPRGNITTQLRNGAGELARVTDAAGLIANYGYYADGTLYYIQRNAGRGIVQNVFYYDALGRKTGQVDPDSGTTTFEYNALGELTAQVDGDGNRIENEIDARGRVWRKTAKQVGGAVESQSTYVFDTAANGVGQLASETITGTYTGWVGQSGVALNYSRSYSFDTLGRGLGSTTGIDGINYNAAVQYDSLGRPWKMQDVSGRWAKTVFNSRGMAQSLCNSSVTDTVATCPLTVDTYLRTLETDAWGHTIKERRGNSTAMDVSRDYVANTGRIFSICAGTVDIQGHCALMTEMYAWDAAGNLSSQSKEPRYVEGFTYDSLNRLVAANLTMEDGITSSKPTQRFQYDMLGNLCLKTTLGASVAYTYAGRAGCGLGGANSTWGGGGTGTAGPHQVSDVNGVFYYFDSRGNQTIKDAPSATYDRTIKYSLDDKAYEASSGTGVQTRFWYGSDGARYKREDGSKRTLYLGNVEIVTEGAVTTVKRTIAGVMLQTVIGATATNYYLFHDQLGNLVKVTNATGTEINSQDYAAFGARRDYNDPMVVGTSYPSLTTRGFTGHEMVDGVLNIIHMNGRIFDPGLGRFLQADPVIQAPDNTQSWNPYTYCLNNPLTYTDPTGTISQSMRQFIAIVIVVVACITQQYWGLKGAAAFWYTVAAGAAAGGVSTQSWQGALYGAFSAAMFYGIGSYFKNAEWAQATAGDQAFSSNLSWGGYGAKVLAHGAAGGIMSRLQGGKFGSGFAAAGVTEAFAPAIDSIGGGQSSYATARVAAAAVVGGTASELSGGKFANGAITAAFSRAFNEEYASHRPTRHELTDRQARAVADLATQKMYEVARMNNQELVRAFPSLEGADDGALEEARGRLLTSLGMMEIKANLQWAVEMQKEDFIFGTVGLSAGAFSEEMGMGWEVFTQTKSIWDLIGFQYFHPNVEIACSPDEGCVYNVH